jgi:hypothetical protein
MAILEPRFSPRFTALAILLVLLGSMLVSSCGDSLIPIVIRSKTPAGNFTTAECWGNRPYAESGCKDPEMWEQAKDRYASIALGAMLFYGAQIKAPGPPPLLTCSPIAFTEASSQQTLLFDVPAGKVDLALLYRQANGNFTAQGFAIAPPMSDNTGTKVGSVTQAQNVFGRCQAGAASTPAPHPVLMADRPGSMARALVITSLGGSNQALIYAYNNSLTVWLDGQDTLGRTKTDYPLTFGSPRVLLAADFNADGKRDVAVLNGAGNGGKGSVQILLGNGNGTLGAARSHDVGTNPMSMAWFDFNGDGRADLAVINQDDNTVTILLANADGSLRTANSYALPGTGSGLEALTVTAADFDGDGKADLFAWNDAGLAFFRGNGDGSFQAAAQKAGYTFTFRPQALATGDLNKDGKTDLVSVNDDGTVTVFWNTGDASFPNQSRHLVGTPVSVGSTAFVMDFNDDGNLDVVLASGHPDALFPGSRFITVLFGNGDGTFKNPVAVSQVDYNSQSMAMADFNGDGLRDVLVTDYNNGFLLAGAAGGGFQAARKLSGMGGDFAVAADLNGDGRADLVTASQYGAGVFTYLGNGDGTFQAKTSYGTNTHPTSAAVGDVNGDGRPDLVVTYGYPRHYQGATISVPASVLLMTAKAGGGFNAGVGVPTGTNTVQAVLADVNGDGKPDLIAVNLGYADQGSSSTPGPGNVTVSLGKGDGTFQAPSGYTVGRNPTTVALADLNGDGKTDLILGAITADPAAKVAVLRGNGDGTFIVPTTMMDVYSWPAGFLPADLDGDGVLDVAVFHAANDAPMTILRGTGGGTLEDLLLIHAGDTPVAAFAADFTGDGRPDLAVLDAVEEGDGAGYVALLRNTSSAATCSYSLTAASQPVAMAGGSGSFQVSATAGCDWTAATGASWITLGFPAWGGNNGRVSFTVAANTGAARTGTITAGGKTFAVNQAGTGGAAGPRAVAIDPGASSGSSGTYTFSFSDSSGWQGINVANILINYAIDGRSACYVAIVPSAANAASVYLVDDGGNAGGPYQGMVLPGSGTVQNSQCSISGTGSSISGSGNTLTVTLAITFKSAFAGNRILYTAAREAAGANSGWQALGTVAVPGNNPTGPAVGGVNPARSSGTGGGAFTFTFTDTNGWQDLGVVNILVNDALNGNNACYLAYSRAYNTLYLVNDSGTALLPGLTLNGAGGLGNSQCTITGAGSSASGAGNTLTLTLNMSFTSGFAGNRIIYMAARSNGDALNSGWQAAGSRTVQ